MFVHHRTSGFILKKVDRRETDQLLTIYTKDFGKLEILAKAVRKIFSKLKSGAEIFYLSEIEFIQGKTRKTLTDAILIEKFENLRKDLKRIKIAYKISEFLDNLISGQEPDEKIWRLLLETFNKLNTRAAAKGEEEDLSSSPTRAAVRRRVKSKKISSFLPSLTERGKAERRSRRDLSLRLATRKLDEERMFFE